MESPSFDQPRNNNNNNNDQKRGQQLGASGNLTSASAASSSAVATTTNNSVEVDIKLSEREAAGNDALGGDLRSQRRSADQQCAQRDREQRTLSLDSSDTNMSNVQNGLSSTAAAVALDGVGDYSDVRSISAYIESTENTQPSCALPFISNYDKEAHGDTICKQQQQPQQQRSPKLTIARNGAVLNDESYSPSPIDNLNASMTNVLTSCNENEPIAASDAASATKGVATKPLRSTSSASNGSLLGLDLGIIVDRPEKIVGVMETYVTYRICTKTNARSDFLDAEYEVRRRYNDFAWLRQHLEAIYPMCLLPPLPEKHSVYSLDRFDAQFIRARCYLLHLFMQSIVHIPRVTRHAHFRAFITADEKDWANYRRHESSSTSMSASAILQALGTAPTRILPVTMTSSESYQFLQQSDLCNDLSQTLAAVDKLSTKCNKSVKQFAHDMGGEQVVFDHWSSIESDVRARSCVHAVSRALLVGHVAVGDVADAHESNVQLPLKHAAAYADAVKTVLRRRDQFEQTVVRNSELLKRKQNELNDLETQCDSSGAQGGSKVKQRDALAKQVDNLRHTVTERELDLRDANFEMATELNRWHRQRRADANSWLRKYVTERIEMHQACLDAWKAALCVIDCDESVISTTTKLRSASDTERDPTITST